MPKPKGLYEDEYLKKDRFSFGSNWQSFLNSFTPRRLAVAKKSLSDFLGGREQIKGKTFLDLGCGSGLFSLAAFELGASQVVSVDVDQYSVACAEALRKRAKKPLNWQIKTGSALNASFIKSLGQFDIVYSWGVLHHTGDMATAIKQASWLVKSDGCFYLAIYNHNGTNAHGSSTFWLRTKAVYNNSPAWVKYLMQLVYSAYLILGLTASGHNPWRYIKNYSSARGMSWHHDVQDWLGGYPYEYATPAELVASFAERGFTLTNSQLVSQTIGCNEYLFRPNLPAKQLDKVTVLMSVHNGAKSLDKSLQSVFDQTVKADVVCVNDASSDSTKEKLQAWQKKFGSRLTILTNKTNLGLTKSLNKGLAAIRTPYTARLDADDWWEPNKLELQLNFLTTNPDYGLVGCWYTNYAHHQRYPQRPLMDASSISRRLIGQNPFAHSAVMFRTPLVRQLGGYNSQVKYGQDYELWLRLEEKAKLFNLPLNLCHRSFTGGISIEKQREQMRSAVQTRLAYIRSRRLPPKSYLSIVEPWLISLVPPAVAAWRRRLADR